MIKKYLLHSPVLFLFCCVLFFCSIIMNLFSFYCMAYDMSDILIFSRNEAVFLLFLSMIAFLSGIYLFYYGLVVCNRHFVVVLLMIIIHITCWIYLLLNGCPHYSFLFTEGLITKSAQLRMQGLIVFNIASGIILCAEWIILIIRLRKQQKEKE